MHRRAGKLGGRMEAVACPSRVQTGGGSDRSGLDAYLLLWHLRLRESVQLRPWAARLRASGRAELTQSVAGRWSRDIRMWAHRVERAQLPRLCSRARCRKGPEPPLCDTSPSAPAGSSSGLSGGAACWLRSPAEASHLMKWQGRGEPEPTASKCSCLVHVNAVCQPRGTSFCNDSLRTTQLSSRRLLLRRAAGSGARVHSGGLGGGAEPTEQHDGLASSGAPRA